jgi:hypothetical protein
MALPLAASTFDANCLKYQPAIMHEVHASILLARDITTPLIFL